MKINEKIKNVFKFTSSRLFYLIFGIFLAVVFSTAYAAWDTRVTTGQRLTIALWNDLVTKVEELDSTSFIGLERLTRTCTISDNDGHSVNQVMTCDLSCSSGKRLISGNGYCNWSIYRPDYHTQRSTDDDTYRVQCKWDDFWNDTLRTNVEIFCIQS